MQTEILKVDNLSFKYRKSDVLFEKLSFSINEGEALGVFGDSGCGKTTLAKCLMRLEKTEKGKIFFKGQEKSHSTKIQIVFQDSASTLNPSWVVYFLLEEPLLIHRPEMTRRERSEKVLELLEWVGLTMKDALCLPHELSGGQRQRVNIARALAVEPRLLILDEPVSQLDTGHQNSILKLLISMQEKLGLSYLLISHDLRVLRSVCHRIVKMDSHGVVSVR